MRCQTPIQTSICLRVSTFLIPHSKLYSYRLSILRRIKLYKLFRRLFLRTYRLHHLQVPPCLHVFVAPAFSLAARAVLPPGGRSRSSSPFPARVLRTTAH